MTYRTAMLAMVCVGVSGLAVAQTPTTPRPPNEAPTTGDSSSRPADASSPHQRDVTSKESHKQMMKDCVDKERAQNSSMPKKDAEKACKEQMKK